jgi:hypothetical protein
LIEVNRHAAAGGTMNLMAAGKAHTGVYWQDCDHGDHCDCLLLARAVGAGAEAVGLNDCREVLQKRWRMPCNHGGRDPGPKRTPELPPRDPADPLQAILVANA